MAESNHQLWRWAIDLMLVRGEVFDGGTPPARAEACYRLFKGSGMTVMHRPTRDIEPPSLQKAMQGDEGMNQREVVQGWPSAITSSGAGRST